MKLNSLCEVNLWLLGTVVDPATGTPAGEGVVVETGMLMTQI